MKNKLILTLDLRVVCVVLVLVVFGMLATWRPWQDSTAVTRTISVTGTGKVTAEPDYYQFNPTYQNSNADTAAAISELNAHLKTVTDKLKELGVQDKDIQVQSSSYDAPKPASAEYLIAPVQSATSAYLTIKVPNKELAQKVQDYLATTDATGQSTPYPSFSDDRQKELKSQAREKAIADAKTQAEKTAQNLGAKLGKVVEVKDSADTTIFPYQDSVSSSSAEPARDIATSLPIYPGEQDVSFTVQTVFEIK